jgi:protein SCO1
VRILGVAVGTAVALLFAAGCGSADADGPAAVVHGSAAGEGPLAGAEVTPAFPLPAETLTSDTGVAVSLDQALDAPVTVFFFGYTRCPDVCPLVMADLTLALARLPDDLRDDVQVAFVTSDPARDTPAVLRAYLERFDPGFAGFTGELETIAEVAGTMGVAVADGRRLPSGGYEVAHGAQLVGYVHDEGVVVWTEGVAVDDLTTDLTSLVEQAATDDEREG